MFQSENKLLQQLFNKIQQLEPEDHIFINIFTNTFMQSIQILNKISLSLNTQNKIFVFTYDYNESSVIKSEFLDGNQIKLTTELQEIQTFDKYKIYRIYNNEQRISLSINNLSALQSSNDVIFNIRHNQVLNQLTKQIVILQQDCSLFEAVLSNIERINQQIVYDMLTNNQIIDRNEYVENFEQKITKNLSYLFKSYSVFNKKILNKELSIQQNIKQKFIVLLYKKYQQRLYKVIIDSPPSFTEINENALKPNSIANQSKQLRSTKTGVTIQNTNYQILSNNIQFQENNINNEQSFDFYKEKLELKEYFQEKYKNYQADTELVLYELEPFFNLQQQPPYTIFVNIYNLVNTNALNNIGLGVFHSSVEISDVVEVAFGGHEFNTTGVYCIKPKSLAQATFYKSIYISHCFMSKQKIIDIILQEAIKWPGNQYQLIHHNCNDFTQDLLTNLIGEKIPQFINRASQIGRKIIKNKNKSVSQQVSGELLEIVKRQGENSIDQQSTNVQDMILTCSENSSQ